MPGISDENERSGASGNHAVNVGQVLASRLKALNDRLEAEAARLRLAGAECDDLRAWLAECLPQASTATEGCNVELAER